MSLPFVTVGSTPECDVCHRYYAERVCEDCGGEAQCSWCNIDRHESIGKRNHWRPRLYGQDPLAHLERNAKASADEAIKEVRRNAGNSSSNGNAGGLEQIQQGDNEDEESYTDDSSSSSSSKMPQFTIDPSTNRLTIITEHVLPISAEDSWTLLGDWDSPFLPWSIDVSSSGDKRVVSLPPEVTGNNAGETMIVTERLIERNEKDRYYSYTRIIPPSYGIEYSDMQSKFEFKDFISMNENRSLKKSILQWTTNVLPKDIKNPHSAAKSIASQFLKMHKQHTHTHTHTHKGSSRQLR